MNDEFYYNNSYIDELNEKINRRFIRNIVKPYNNDLKKKPIYRIPNSSDWLPKKPVQPGINFTMPQGINDRVETGIHEKYTPAPKYIPVYVEQSCKNINDHVHSCQICSQLYRPYNNILLIIIFILVIIILFLIKKIYNF